MLTLGVDCSCGWTHIGVATDPDTPLASVDLDLKRRQASYLPQATEQLLSSLGISFSDLERVSLTIGPGFFTGIRIGVAYATALAEAKSLPLCTLSTLEALAWECREMLRVGEYVMPLLRAKKTTFIGAVYRCGHDGCLMEILPPAHEEFAFWRQLDRERILPAESGSAFVAEGGLLTLIPHTDTSGMQFARCVLHRGPRGDSVACLGTDPSREPLDASEVRPFYLHDSAGLF